MCEYCDMVNKEKITFEIHKPYEDTYIKLDKAIEILEKAMGGGKRQLTEISPYLAMRELEDKSKQEVEKGLFDLYQSISRKWIGLQKADTDPFKLNNQTYINPQTGKPLTNKEWAVMKEDVLKAFSKIYKGQDEQIIKSAMALGKILKGMPTKKAVSTPLKDLTIQLGQEVKKLEEDPVFANTLQFAEQHTGELIVDISQSQYKNIHDTILQAQVNRLSPKQLEAELFDKFSDMNRDWRMIAETEIANNENNGQLLSALSRAKDQKEPTFLLGGSSGGACTWCRSMVNNKVVMVVEEPPTGGGDIVVYKDKQYTAVWPGKSNAGRKRSNWWVASGAQHPHCRCYWVEYIPGYEDEWKILQDAIKKASAESEAIKKEYEKPTWLRNV